MSQAKIFSLFLIREQQGSDKLEWMVFHIAATSSREAEVIFRKQDTQHEWMKQGKLFINTDHEHISAVSLLCAINRGEMTYEGFRVWVDMHTRNRFEDGELIEPTFRPIK